MTDTTIPTYRTGHFDSGTTHDPFRALTVATLNVRGGNEDYFFTYLANYCTTNNINIMGVQETKINKAANKDRHLLKSDSTSQYIGLWNHTTAHFNGKGVGLLIHKAWAQHLIERFDDGNGRGIGALFGFKHGFRVAVINCYFPPRGSNTREADFPQLHQWVTTQVDRMRNAGNHVLLLGDFNGVVDPAIDRSSDNHASATPELALFPWLMGGRFVDTYRFLHPTTTEYTFKDISRIDLVWTSPGLAPYLLRSNITASDDMTSSDHAVMSATFDLHNLIHPMSQAEYSKLRVKGKKLQLEHVEEEAWDKFSSQIEVMLPRHGNLDLAPIIFPDDFLLGPEMEPLPRDCLETLPIDHVWKALQEAIMSSALAHLPSVKTGGMPPPPEGEGRFRAQISDLGNIIRAAREAFGPLSQADMDSKKATRRQIHRWYGQNGEEMGVPRVPEVDGSGEVWQAWVDSVRVHWRQARLQHQNYIAANKQDIITAHIENRDQRFATHTKKTIRSILEVFDGRVNLDHLIIDSEEGPYVEVDPTEIKTQVREYFEKTFHKARPTQPLDDFWQNAYKEREDIRDEWYTPVMATPSYEEVCEAIGDAPKGKAAGVSGITGDLLKRLGPIAQALFVVLVQACFVQVAMPKDWYRGVIYCIPKGPVWSGRISEVRPITLLEHARKIFFSIMVRRLTTVMSSHPIFRGPNFSVLKGTMTKDPIHILNSIMEDAREYNKEVWVLFQDIRRCFDSVSCQSEGMLELGLRHLKVPEEFIRLCLNIGASKSNQIITAYGLTDPYHPECGLDQGGVECPLLWRISYEVLLAVVMESGLGYPMMRKAGLQAFHSIPSFESVYLDTPLVISCLAFMDDTDWIAKNKENLQKIIDIAMSFFHLHGIEINPKKSELIAINPTSADLSVRIGDDTVKALAPGAAARMLGVWFSGDGKNAYTREIVQ